MQERRDASQSYNPYEVEPTIIAEENLQNLLSWIENVDLIPVFGPREPGKRANKCGTTTDVVKLAAEMLGIDSLTIQVDTIHQSLGGVEEEIFTHAFNILKINDLPFLVDLTFCQFIDPQTGNLIHPEVIDASGNINDFPVIEKLQTDGFILATDDVMIEYLKATTASKDKSYLDSVRATSITENKDLDLDYENLELAENILGVGYPNPDIF